MLLVVFVVGALGTLWLKPRLSAGNPGAVQQVAEKERFGVVREYVGHGIGRAMHEDPPVPNYGNPGQGPLLRPGMALAIEPMLNLGGPQTRVGDDGWTVFTKDGRISAHFEHTIAISEGDAEVLTRP